jgi:nickel-dependent lactate racemase
VVAGALDRPLDGQPLETLAQGRRQATVIVPDATRRAALPEVLPQVLRRLERGGVRTSSINILVACGTHPPADPESLRQLLGPLPPEVRVLQHDSRDEGALVAVGELRPGLPLRLHREVVNCDLLVTVGTVRHHYFAGFGGGPKMVFPGVGGHQEIQANHSLVLRRTNGEWERHPKCEPGVIDGNPVAEEIARAVDLRPPELALCLVEDGFGEVAWAESGTWRTAFTAAVDRVRGWYEIPRPSPFDLMVACGGGSPADQTLIQAHKGLDAACRFLAPGGKILYLASLEGGAGSEAMEEFLADPRPEVILRKLGESWVQYGHTTLRLVEKTSAYTVHLHAHLDHALAERLGFDCVADPAAVVGAWREEFPGATVGVMASGAVYPST